MLPPNILEQNESSTNRNILSWNLNDINRNLGISSSVKTILIYIGKHLYIKFCNWKMISNPYISAQRDDNIIGIMKICNNYIYDLETLLYG